MRAYIFLLLIILSSCVNDAVENHNTTNKEVQIKMADGIWRLVLDIEKDKLPFNFIYTNVDGKPSITITNAQERIDAINILQRNDSIFFETPLFPSKFFGKIISPTEVSGYWINYGKSEDYKLNFVATQGAKFRFEQSGKPDQDLAEKWEVHFSPNNIEDAYSAIGLFTFKAPNIVYGTFATETGDYRFLEGNLVGDKLQLSCFDGSHAFLFKATLKDDKMVDGVFYSGNHWEEPWGAVANPNFELTDPDLITKVTETDQWKKMSVTDNKGKVISFGDMSLDNKVTIIQIMGSWCPNCIDESKYYSELYDKYRHQGLEIIGVAFEKKEVGLKNIEHLRKRLKIPYNIYLGGEKNKGVAAALFNMLDNISSFPTSIIIDKKGKIQRVHTGFYGPGTGSYYSEYVADMDEFIGELLAE